MEKRIESRERLVSIMKKYADTAIDGLFEKAHELAGTKSGDIDPMQVLELEDISKRLVSLIAEQVWQNMELPE